MPPVYDQGQLGSCVANATAAIVDYERKRQGLRFMTPSRLFIYWNARDLEQSTDSDSGCMIRDAMKSLDKQGVCVESFWHYTEPFDRQPKSLCYSTAIRHQTLQYSAPSQSAMALKLGLAAGIPFVFGFSVYESFMSDHVAQTGVVPMPSPSEGQIGGHAVAGIGYDDLSGPSALGSRPPVPSFLCRNSWGTAWGLQGHFWMPFEYVLSPDLSDDFWQITSEEG
jgi:C1A family cysteine protease